MAIQILQKPGDIQPAQSPIVFSVFESGSNAYTASEFQYVAYLWIWQGDLSQSGSYDYQLRKFPNVSGSGIFDFNRIINSQLQDLSATNSSNILYYKASFGWQYASSSTYVTQSGGLTPVTCSTGGTMFKAYDGYAVFPDPINDTLISQSAYWPFMTDMGSVTQSVQITDTSTISGSRGVAIWVGANDTKYPRAWVITGSYANGTTLSNLTDISALTASTTTSLQVYQAPVCPGDSGFSIATTNGGFPLVSYKVTAISGSATLATLNYKIQDECYYTPVRIAFKNKYGQFDWFNFYKAKFETFNTDQRLYQPQLGSWSSQTLTYDQYQTRQQRYIVDATEVLTVNTDYLEQGYNNLFKQLLVSDEIYWQLDTSGNVRPLTIQTNSLQFKTGVNNKLIQYTITFDIGQPFKLLL